MLIFSLLELCYLTVSITYPMTDRIPAVIPVKTAPYGWTSRATDEPMATPPARVEFCTCTISNFLFSLYQDETANVVTQQEHREMYVLTMARYFKSSGSPMALKLGQWSHRKMVPTKFKCSKYPRISLNFRIEIQKIYKRIRPNNSVNRIEKKRDSCKLTLESNGCSSKPLNP